MSFPIPDFPLKPINLSHDGTLLAVYGQNGPDIYDTRTGQLKISLISLVHTFDSRCAVSFTLDNTHLVVGWPRGVVWVFEIATGRTRSSHHLLGVTENVSCIAICPSFQSDYYQIAYADTGGTVLVFTEDALSNYSFMIATSESKTITALAFLNPRSLGARLSNGDVIMLWDMYPRFDTVTATKTTTPISAPLEKFHKRLPSANGVAGNIELLVSQDGTDMKFYTQYELGGATSNRIACASGSKGEVRFYDTEDGETFYILHGESFGHEFTGNLRL
jgi:WD40 repeat protein